MPRSRGQIIAIVIVAVVAVLVGFVANVLVAMMGTERKDMAYRGGWDPSAIYKLRHNLYLMEVNDKLVLQPPIDQSPMRDYYSDEELARGLPPVAEYRQQNLNRPGVLGFVDAGTTLRFDHVIRSQSVWDATLDYWGTITSGPHAGKRVILDNLNVWDSGDAPRNPDPNLIVPTRRTTQTRPNR